MRAPIDNQRQEEACLYVLDALSPQERAAFEARMEADPRLRQFVERQREDVATLAWAAPPVDAPEGALDGILSRIDEAEENAASAKTTAFPVLGWLRPGWAAAAVLLLGFGLFFFWTGQQREATWHELEDRITELEAERDAARTAVAEARREHLEDIRTYQRRLDEARADREETIAATEETVEMLGEEIDLLRDENRVLSEIVNDLRLTWASDPLPDSPEDDATVAANGLFVAHMAGPDDRGAIVPGPTLSNVGLGTTLVDMMVEMRLRAASSGAPTRELTEGFVAYDQSSRTVSFVAQNMVHHQDKPGGVGPFNLWVVDASGRTVHAGEFRNDQAWFVSGSYTLGDTVGEPAAFYLTENPDPNETPWLITLPPTG